MRLRYCLAVALVAASSLCAQKVISARSGLIHDIDGGGATVDGKTLKPKYGEFPILENGQVLESNEGRVEMLLSAGVFLRLDEHSSAKMISNKLADTRVELLSGSAIVEMDETEKGTSTMLLFHDAKITPLKHGLYRLDADQNRFRVFDGEAQVLRGDDSSIVKAGRQVVFGAVLAASKFDRKAMDPLDQWSAERSGEIARVNAASANSMRAAGKGAMNTYVSGGWFWNPYYGMFSFLPAYGWGYNPYGWYVYSPQTIGYAYAYGYGYPGAGNNNGSGTNRGAVQNSSNTGFASQNSAVGSSIAPSAMSSGGFGGGGGGGFSGGGARGAASAGGGGRGR